MDDSLREMSSAVTEQPYEWPTDAAERPSAEVLQLWTDVGNGLEKSQTFMWKSAVESLDHANKNLQTSQDARLFLEKYMTQIIDILVAQMPNKIGPYERECIQDSLSKAIDIVAQDLDIQILRNGECLLLQALAHVFSKDKRYYCCKKRAREENVPPANNGLPHLRMRMINRFHESNGFRLLHTYMLQKIGTPAFPKFLPIHHILTALVDNLVVLNTRNGSSITKKKEEDDAINIGNAVMQYINSMTNDDLKKIPLLELSQLHQDLKNLFDQLVNTRRSKTHVFYAYWMALVLRLINSQSLPHKLFGCESVKKLIDACAKHRPPPHSFVVTNAGCSFVNGKYDYAGPVTSEGYAKFGGDVLYVRKIPEGEEQGGHKLTIVRYTMRTHQKWWYLSEADEEQPGTDRDIDYYQHKSKEHEEAVPPPRGWTKCHSAGIDPPPQLQARGCLVPPGEERKTLEHVLAEWVIDKDIVEKLPNSSDDNMCHIAACSTALSKFLAYMYKSEHYQKCQESSAGTCSNAVSLPSRISTLSVKNHMPLDPHSRTDDSDDMNDPEDDDDDDENTTDVFALETNDGPHQIIIDQAGAPEVNGVYGQDGYFEHACKYSREGTWNDSNYKFSIFQCNVSNNTKHWYISIVPYAGGNPGTTSDIDFYSAPATPECMHVPPTKGWVTASEGQEPSPMLSYRNKIEVMET